MTNLVPFFTDDDMDAALRWDDSPMSDFSDFDSSWSPNSAFSDIDGTLNVVTDERVPPPIIHHHVSSVIADEHQLSYGYYTNDSLTDMSFSTSSSLSSSYFPNGSSSDGHYPSPPFVNYIPDNCLEYDSASTTPGYAKFDSNLTSRLCNKPLIGNGTTSSHHSSHHHPPRKVHQRRAANMRERKRMKTINEAFDSLRERIPVAGGAERKLSKVT